MKNLLFILFFFASSLIIAQDYKQIKINLSHPSDAIRLAEQGIDLEHSHVGKENDLVLFVNQDEFEVVQSLGVSYQIIIDDWYSYYNSLPALTESEKSSIKSNSKENFGVDGFGFGSMGGYYTFNEIVANLDSMFVQYPNIITQKYSIGTSHEGRTIWAVKISDNPNIAENEAPVGYDALIHAREPQSMASLMYFMWYLLENYGTNPEVTYLVNNREMYFVPCFNPDGYEYNRVSNPTGGGMWRKNRKINGDGSYGVDMNRNFSYQWGYDNVGSSPDPSSETYRGPFAFSEPETQAVRDLTILKNYKTHFNMHSYQNAFLYPWGYINLQTPDSLLYREFAQDLSSYNGYVYGISGQILGYNSNGSVRDWMYGEQSAKGKTFGYTVEIGSSSDGFWPIQSRIYPLAQGMLQPCLYQAWVAGESVFLTDPGYSEQYFDPGETVTMNSTFMNKGLSNAANLQFNLTSLSPFITITNGTSSISNLPSRTSAIVNSPFSFQINPSAPIDTTVKLLLATSSSSSQMRLDTLSLVLGTPIILFSDTTNDPTVLWTITATPATPKWEATNLQFYSSPSSFTDSKTGNYLSNATVTMTLTNPIDLSSYSNPTLSFWTKYDIESNWDFGQVKISTNNGSTWTALQGLYTELASGTFQPSGEYVYDGLRANWVQEEISLAGYNSSQTKLRFELRSDGSVTKDGWYIDDIGISVFGIVPVELSSFSASSINGQIKLDWTTSSETNNSGFELQRSKFEIDAPANRRWNKIGFVEGLGTSTEINHYSFTDQFPKSEKSYYRLKQIDYDGTFSFSQEVEIDFASVTEFSLAQNYPNPFNPSTKIRYSIPTPPISSPLAKGRTEEGFVKLKVFDVLGNEVATLVNENKPAGNYEVEFNVAQSTDGGSSPAITSGVYFYQLKVGEFSETKKMLLLK